MKKIGLLFATVFIFAVSGFAQNSPADPKPSQAGEELKAALVSKLGLSQEAAGKIVVIENDFYQRLTDIEALGNIHTKDKEVKLNEAHTIRRADLLAVPLTGRQMEDVIELNAQVRQKHKL